MPWDGSSCGASGALGPVLATAFRMFGSSACMFLRQLGLPRLVWYSRQNTPAERTDLTHSLFVELGPLVSLPLACHGRIDRHADGLRTPRTSAPDTLETKRDGSECHETHLVPEFRDLFEDRLALLAVPVHVELRAGGQYPRVDRSAKGGRTW